MTFQKVELGDTVRDRVTGFEGTATSRVEYLTGCIQFGVLPKVGADSKYPDVIYIDEQRIEIVGKNPRISARPTGGPQTDAPRG